AQPVGEYDAAMVDGVHDLTLASPDRHPLPAHVAALAGTTELVRRTPGHRPPQATAQRPTGLTAQHRLQLRAGDGIALPLRARARLALDLAQHLLQGIAIARALLQLIALRGNVRV